MREILFRGKQLYDGVWVYGSLLAFPDGETYIAQKTEFDFELRKIQVDPATVGQYTGVTDRNGKKIFEGDIISENGQRNAFFEVWWSEGNCGFVAGCGVHIRPHMNQATIAAYEIVGNVYDNPDLIGGDADAKT